MLEIIHDNQGASKRDPARTRKKLLEAAFQQIHAHGFQAVSLDEILSHTGVTKGALYYHFPNKTALGYAVVDEIIGPSLLSHWVTPIIHADEPLAALQQIIRQAGESMTLDELRLGCPLNNLSQEMSTADEGFRRRLQSIYDQWRDGLVKSFQRAINEGQMRDDVDAGSVASFIVAALEGCIGMAKNAQSMDMLMQCGNGVLEYLESLKR